jgi:hypothetical protein
VLLVAARRWVLTGNTFLLGFPNWPVIYFIITTPSIAIKTFSGAVAGEKEDFCKGSFARTSFTLF